MHDFITNSKLIEKKSLGLKRCAYPPLCLKRGLAPNGSKVKYMRSPGWFPNT